MSRFGISTQDITGYLLDLTGLLYLIPFNPVLNPVVSRVLFYRFSTISKNSPKNYFLRLKVPIKNYIRRLIRGLLIPIGLTALDNYANL